MSPRMRALQIVAAVLAVIAVGCQQPSSDARQAPQENTTNSETPPLGPGSLASASEPAERATPEVDAAAKKRAIVAKDALLKQLSTRLKQALTQDGPAAAIEVCIREAAQISNEVGKQHGLKLGRTSFKLRNSRNTPPDWAQTLVKNRTAETTFVSTAKGTVGGLFPIRLQDKCLTCHGPSEEMPADVRAKLDELYPNDQARGFRVGDLRGWLWVETSASGDAQSSPEDDSVEVGHDHQHGRGRGFRGGRGMRGAGRGMGRGPGPGMREDMTTIHAMFDARDKITRKIRNLPNGAETITESKDEAIADLIPEHVPAMEGRVNEDKPLPPMTFHPLFVELIKHADKVEFSYEPTKEGVKVTYTSEDPHMVLVIQEHAKLVSRFIANGHAEIHKPYKLPQPTAKK